MEFTTIRCGGLAFSAIVLVMQPKARLVHRLAWPPYTPVDRSTIRGPLVIGPYYFCTYFKCRLHPYSLHYITSSHIQLRVNSDQNVLLFVLMRQFAMLT